MLKERDKVRYKSDGTTAWVIDVQPRVITLLLLNGQQRHLRPDAAPNVLDVWRGDLKTGAWATLS